MIYFSLLIKVLYFFRL